MWLSRPTQSVYRIAPPHPLAPLPTPPGGKGTPPPAPLSGEFRSSVTVRRAMDRDLGWVVLKFGGTSVATAERWATIAGRVERRLAEGRRPLVVCSALAGVSNRLEEMLALAVAGSHQEALAEIRERHLRLREALGLPAGDGLGADLEELARLALGAALLGDAGAPLKARVMAFGELLATRLGAAYLNASGIPTAWLDARTALLARDEQPAHSTRSYLAASCDA